MHVRQEGRQHALARHAVQQAAGHHHVDERRVGHGEHRDHRHDVFHRQAGRGALDHQHQRRAAAGQFAHRHQRHRADRHQHVDHRSQPQAGQHHLGENAAGVVGLLGHVDRVLEADHGEECQRRGRGDGQEHALVFRRVEGDDAREIGLALRHGVEAQQDHHQQARQFDQGQHHVGAHALGRAAQVHQHHQRHEAQRARGDPGLVGLDAEGREQVGQRGQQRHAEGHQERQPGRAADFLGDLSGQGVDAGAQDVTDDEQQ
ncbi:hypothetical protein BBAD15_g12465 [Beauveria bassiana D1-5]|uniref:Uncharacterized protein n=1 Tax=Beauveria bassiana D1-5 TaxID=1245745 RepID=A0A0A2V896_BEABA|nr:hypothetical protein BBAD15_g12465 [Beauveria bassiana D1-5]